MNQHEVKDIRRKGAWKEQFSEDIFQGQSKSKKRQNTNVLSQDKEGEKGFEKPRRERITK
jgi:hypothetical protein